MTAAAGCLTAHPTTRSWSRLRSRRSPRRWQPSSGLAAAWCSQSGPAAMSRSCCSSVPRPGCSGGKCSPWPRSSACTGNTASRPGPDRAPAVRGPAARRASRHCGRCWSRRLNTRLITTSRGLVDQSVPSPEPAGSCAGPQASRPLLTVAMAGASAKPEGSRDDACRDASSLDREIERRGNVQVTAPRRRRISATASGRAEIVRPAA